FFYRSGSLFFWRFLCFWLTFILAFICWVVRDTSMGKFFLTTLLAVAEIERNTIIERTQTGKSIEDKGRF
ncbi:recombinase family protein, partial [Desulfosporosinus nitroreducens]